MGTEESNMGLMGRVLVVVDDRPFSEILTTTLKEQKLDTRVEFDGKHGLDAIQSYEPDVVVLDVSLPRVSGHEVLMRIRSDHSRLILPVILVSESNDVADIVKGLQLGADDYIVRPIQPEVFVARVWTQLRLKWLWDQRERDLETLTRLNAVKDKFLKIASHDLRGPLFNILSGITLLTRLSTPHEETADLYKDAVSRLRSTISTMNVIVDDFLDMQAMNAGQLVLKQETFDLNMIITRTCGMLRFLADDKGQTLNLEMTENLPRVYVDSDRIGQVLSNLLSNAIKYSPRDSTISIRTMIREKGVRCEVCDQGPGIPKDELNTIFEEFVNHSSKPTEGESSKGVGLSVARQLIELHEGTIGVESTEGEGTTFWFDLPVFQGEHKVIL